MGVERQQIAPPGPKPVGPYSPGVLAGGFLYVSGQGARDASGKLPEGIEAQTKQCLENVKLIVEAAGLTMEHVVYTQAYLSDIANYDKMNEVYATYFPKNPPARSTVGVTRMPTDTPVEIAAVAVRDLAQKKVVSFTGTNPVPISPAMMAGERLYLSGILGRDADSNRMPAKISDQAKMVFDRATQVMKQARMNLGDLQFVNIYYTDKMPLEEVRKAAEKHLKTGTARAYVPVAAIPMGANIEISGVANAKDTFFLSMKTGTTQEVLDGLKAELTAKGLTMDNVVAANVYIDDINNFATMNKTYASFFGTVPPTRTTVQPTPPAAGKPNSISLVAVK
jgi:2-iminobutanoate/2-iminopropanoate deaminase